MDVAVVIPTIRNLNSDYLEPLLDRQDVHFIIVDDTDGDVEPINSRCDMIHEKQRNQLVGDKLEHIAPHKSPVRRNIGIYKAYKDGFPFIITIDDDVKVGEFFIEEHIGPLITEGRTSWSTNTGWANTIGESDFFPRGFPYEHRVDMSHTRTDINDVSCLNIGLWTNILDYNGMDKIDWSLMKSSGDAVVFREDMPTQCRWHGTTYTNDYVPACAMNIAARNDSAIGLFQIPCRHEFMGYQLNRIEDIWGGMIFQRVARAAEQFFSFGEPIVEHTKDGNIGYEISSEHYVNMITPILQKVLDTTRCEGVSYGEDLDRVARALRGYKTYPLYKPLFGQMADSIEAWSGLFTGT